MRYIYDSSVSARQRHLIEQAINYCTYPLALIDVEVTFSVVDEPTCPGHQDYMCTTETVMGTSGTAAVQIRTAADDPQAQVNFVNGRRTQDEVDKFFMESIIHELGHCVTFIFIQDDTAKTAVAQLFHKSGPTGEGNAQGVLADWNPLAGKWEDRIQEAAAEVFKDTYLADQYRLYDNRSNWDLTTGDHTTLMHMLLPPSVSGAVNRYVWMREEAALPNWLLYMDSSTTIINILGIGHGYRNIHFRSVQKGESQGIPGWTPPWNDGVMLNYDNDHPLKVVLSYGDEWYGVWNGSIDFLNNIPEEDIGDENCAWTHNYPTNCLSYAAADYHLHAELSDLRNGKFFEYDVHVTGGTPPTVFREDIIPPHPVDARSLVGTIDVQGFVPDYWGGYGGIESGPSDGGVRGVSPRDYGAFKFYSHDVQDQIPGYPYKEPSINAQAKALGAINLARARAALH